MIDLEYALGQKVKFRFPLKRVAERKTYRKVWKPQTQREHATFREGIIVGVRTLSDGKARYSYYEAEYRADTHYRAYIVAYDIRRKPRLVLPADIEPV